MSSLKAHKRDNHCLDETLQCSLCGDRFSSLHDLCDHKRQVHKVEKYVCDECNYSAKTRSELKAHVDNHVSHSCGQCKFRTIHEHVLNNHVKAKHSREYECGFCNFKTSSKDMLNNHDKRVHRTLPSHQCDYCGEKFQGKSLLTDHIKVNHDMYGRAKFYNEEPKKYCRYFRNSVCHYGNRCKFAHENPPFREYDESCRFKSRCQYDHSTETVKERQGF